MRWVAPTEKDTANQTLEKRLWAAADQFRANSGLKAGQYSTPVLGLIFLRFAEARFAQRRAQLRNRSHYSRCERNSVGGGLQDQPPRRI
jgi:type I restriction enzyme M protein